MSIETKAKRQRKPKPRPEPEMVRHIEVAARLGIDTETLRKWIGRGSWPLPHATIEQTLFFRRDLIDHFFAKGEWLDTARFKPGEGRGRTPPDPQALPDLE